MTIKSLFNDGTYEKEVIIKKDKEIITIDDFVDMVFDMAISLGYDKDIVLDTMGDYSA